MGYYTTISGTVTVSGGVIPDSVLESEGWLHSDNAGYGKVDDDYFIIQTDGDPDDVQLVNGQITVVPGTQWQEVTLRWEDSLKAYNFTERCEVLLDRAKNAGASLSGEFKGVGEENGDVWRIKFSGQTMKYEQAEMRWPDGTVVT